MNKRSLLITLGHNSSAILVENGKVKCGYEEERLSKVKSDSAFPRLAIMQCLNKLYSPELEHVYVSYWNDAFDVFTPGHECFSDKHIDYKFLNTICKQYHTKIEYLNEKFTHHDAHAFAALNFFENHASDADRALPFHVIVSDGFGNREEVTTIYKVDYSNTATPLQIVDKISGYFGSVGLMYQYATSFCGMKENEDEYKFLGYESHIGEALTDLQRDVLKKYTDAFSAKFINFAEKGKAEAEFNSYINLSKLAAVKQWWANEYTTVLQHLKANSQSAEFTEFQVRCIIAYFIQNVIERFIGHFIDKHSISNVILSGGIFYNVKLNNSIMKKISGKICVYPLAGDQGAAVGLYRAANGTLTFRHLFLGERSLRMNKKTFNYMNASGIKHFEYYEDKPKFIARIAELVNDNKIVNVITDSMEFGPRALGSTTTLALPTKENVSYINKLNCRNDVMPMAPQILASKARKYFGDQIDKIIGSNFYMIITMDQLTTPSEEYIGISHRYPLSDVYSSRCQIVDDNSTQYARYVLEKVNSDFVINTSNNFHGTPILYSLFDAIRNHEFTSKNDTENRSYSIVGAF